MKTEYGAWMECGREDELKHSASTLGMVPGGRSHSGIMAILSRFSPA